MGQRSQIYIRYDVTTKSGDNYKGIIARYYGWNYGERMVSRARYILENIYHRYIPYQYTWNDKKELERLSRFCDINFDMKDIATSLNIIDEVNEYNDLDYLFNQDNCDGQLLIDVKDNQLKYCFIDIFDKIPMNAEEYMKKYISYLEDGKDSKTIRYTRSNINKINKIAKLMTQEEVDEYLNADYSYILKETAE